MPPRRQYAADAPVTPRKRRSRAQDEEEPEVKRSRVSGRKNGNTCLIVECQKYLSSHIPAARMDYCDALRQGVEPVPLLEHVEKAINKRRDAEFLLQNSLGSVVLRSETRVCVHMSEKLGKPKTINEVLVSTPADVPEPFYLDGDSRRTVRAALWRARDGPLPDIGELLSLVGLDKSKKTDLSAVAELLGNNTVVIYRAEILHDARKVIKDELGIKDGTGLLNDLIHLLTHSIPPRGARCVVLHSCNSPLPVEAFARLRDAQVKLRGCRGAKNTGLLKKLQKQFASSDVILATCGVDFDKEDALLKSVLQLPHCDDGCWTEELLDDMEQMLAHAGVIFQPGRRVSLKTTAAGSNATSTTQKKPAGTPWCIIKVGALSKGEQPGEEALLEALKAGHWQLKRNGTVDSIYVAVTHVDGPFAPGEVPHPQDWCAMDEKTLLPLFRAEHRARVQKTVEMHRMFTESGVVALVPFPSAALSALGVHQKIVRSQLAAQRCRQISSTQCRQVVVGDYGTMKLGSSFPDGFPQSELGGNVDELVERIALQHEAVVAAWEAAKVPIRPSPSGALMRFVTIRDTLATQTRSCSEIHEQVVLFPDGIGSATMEFVDAAVAFAKLRCAAAEGVFLCGDIAEAYGHKMVPHTAQQLRSSQSGEIKIFSRMLSTAMRALTEDHIDDDDEDPERGISKDLVDLVDRLISKETIEEEHRDGCLRYLKAVERSFTSLDIKAITVDDDAEGSAQVSPTLRLGYLAGHLATTIRGHADDGGTSFCRELKKKMQSCLAWHLRSLAHQKCSPVARQMMTVRVVPQTKEAVEEVLEKTDKLLKDIFGEPIMESLIKFSADPAGTGISFHQSLLFSALWKWQPNLKQNRGIAVPFSPLDQPTLTLQCFLSSLETRCNVASAVANVLVKQCKEGRCAGKRPWSTSAMMEHYVTMFEARDREKQLPDDIEDMIEDAIKFDLEALRA